MKHVTGLARIALGAIVLSSSIAFADNCKIAKGTISPLQPVPPESCASAYGCFTGTVSGDLSGTFQSELATLSFDSAQGIVQFTASTLLTTRDGTLFTSDAGSAINCHISSTGLVCSDSAEILKITSGWGAYAQAYGSIYLMGPYLSGQPEQRGVYQGLICTSKAK